MQIKWNPKNTGKWALGLGVFAATAAKPEILAGIATVTTGASLLAPFFNKASKNIEKIPYDDRLYVKHRSERGISFNYGQRPSGSLYVDAFFDDGYSSRHSHSTMGGPETVIIREHDTRFFPRDSLIRQTMGEQIIEQVPHIDTLYVHSCNIDLDDSLPHRLEIASQITGTDKEKPNYIILNDPKHLTQAPSSLTGDIPIMSAVYRTVLSGMHFLEKVGIKPKECGAEYKHSFSVYERDEQSGTYNKISKHDTDNGAAVHHYSLPAIAYNHVAPYIDGLASTMLHGFGAAVLGRDAVRVAEDGMKETILKGALINRKNPDLHYFSKVSRNLVRPIGTALYVAATVFGQKNKIIEKSSDFYRNKLTPNP